MSLFSYKKVISFVMIIAVALATGFSVGKIYLDMFGIKQLNITGSEAEFREDSRVIEKLVADSNTKDVMDFSGIELYQIAEYKLNQKSLFLKETIGTVTSTGQKMFMRSQKVKAGEYSTYYKLSPSKTVMGIQTPQVCSKINYNSKTKKIEIVPNERGVFTNTESSATLDADFSAKADVYTEEEYYELFKTSPTTVLNYIVSNKTSQNCVSDVRDNGDGTYSFDITYTNKDGVIDAAFFYSYEILFSSGYSLPYWDSVNITVTINSTFNFKTISYLEKYSVSSSKIPLLGKASVVNDVVDTFYYDADSINQHVLADFKTFAEVK